MVLSSFPVLSPGISRPTLDQSAPTPSEVLLLNETSDFVSEGPETRCTQSPLVDPPLGVPVPSESGSTPVSPTGYPDVTEPFAR